MVTKNTKIETVTIDQLKPYEGQMGTNDENDFLPIYDVVDGENVNKTGGTRALTVKKLKELMMAMSAEYLNKISKTTFESLSGYHTQAPEPSTQATGDGMKGSSRTTAAAADGEEENPIPTPDLAILLNAAFNYIKNNLYDIKGYLSGEGDALDVLNDDFAKALQRTGANGVFNLDEELFTYLNLSVLIDIFGGKVEQNPDGSVGKKGVYYKDTTKASLLKGGLDLFRETVWNFVSEVWVPKHLGYTGAPDTDSSYVYPVSDPQYRTLQGIELPYGEVVSPGKDAHDCVVYIENTPSWSIYSDAQAWPSDPQRSPVASDVLTFAGLTTKLNDSILEVDSLIYTDETGGEIVLRQDVDWIQKFEEPKSSDLGITGNIYMKYLFSTESPSALLDYPLAVWPRAVTKAEYPIPDIKYTVTFQDQSQEEVTVAFYFRTGYSSGEIESYVRDTLHGTLVADWDPMTEGDIYIYQGDGKAHVFWASFAEIPEGVTVASYWSREGILWAKPTVEDPHLPFYVSELASIQELGYYANTNYSFYEVKKQEGAQESWTFKYKSASEEIITLISYSSDGYRSSEESPVYTAGRGRPVRRIRWHGWHIDKDTKLTGDDILIHCEQINGIWSGKVLHYNEYLTSEPACLALNTNYPQSGSNTEQHTLIEQIAAENRIVATPEDLAQCRIVTYQYDLDSGDTMVLDQAYYYSFFMSLYPKEFCSGLFRLISSFLKRNPDDK